MRVSFCLPALRRAATVPLAVASGAAWAQLSLSPYAAAGTIDTLELSRDGRRVVYSGAFETNGLAEQRLSPNYVQDKRLNGDPVTGGRVEALAIYPDSAGTLYYSDELADTRYHLFTVDSRVFGDGFEEGTTAAWPNVF